MTQHHTVTLCGTPLDQPGHICAFFDSRDEEYDVLVPYYKEGIEQGEQVITIVDGSAHGAHCAHLESRGLAVRESVENGSLTVLTAEDTYIKSGHFAAEGMYATLQGALADAARNNRRVRTSGVMDWSLRGHPGTEQLMEYEARVNVLVPTFNCTLLCVYDINEISGRTMMDILATHPYIIHRREIRKNPYYIPPIELLRQTLMASPQAQLET